jgi:hypothetical protein
LSGAKTNVSLKSNVSAPQEPKIDPTDANVNKLIDAVLPDDALKKTESKA